MGQDFALCRYFPTYADIYFNLSIVDKRHLTWKILIGNRLIVPCFDSDCLMPTRSQRRMVLRLPYLTKDTIRTSLRAQHGTIGSYGAASSSQHQLLAQGVKKKAEAKARAPFIFGLCFCFCLLSACARHRKFIRSTTTSPPPNSNHHQ